MQYDVIIVGGGPGGLAAALTLGRARLRVLLCDAGPRRNAAAVNIHNFVTRDGTPPDEFRRIGREQLATYPGVELRDEGVESITGTRGRFRAKLRSGVVEARRVLLCTGMIDELLPIEGYRALWGTSIVQCPYCHGWEVRGRRWGVLASPQHPQMLLPFALLLRQWTDDLVVLTHGRVELDDDQRARLRAAGVRIETAPVARLVARGDQLEAVELSTGMTVPCQMLFSHPPQRHVDVVRSLDLQLDDAGYVRVDGMTSETSTPGIYAAGDLATLMQGATLAAAAGSRAAAMLNYDLAMERGLGDAAPSQRSAE